MKKRIVTVALVVCLMFLIAGCGESSDPLRVEITKVYYEGDAGFCSHNLMIEYTLQENIYAKELLCKLNNNEVQRDIDYIHKNAFEKTATIMKGVKIYISTQIRVEDCLDGKIKIEIYAIKATKDIEKINFAYATEIAAARELIFTEKINVKF